jgi:hypothetical protein
MTRNELVHRMREEVMHDLFRTGMTPYDEAVFFRKMNAPKERVELELARRTPSAFLVAFGLITELVTKDLAAQARPSMCSRPSSMTGILSVSGSSYQFLS